MVSPRSSSALLHDEIWAEFCRTVEQRIEYARARHEDKQCTICGEVKPIEDFHVRDRGKRYVEPSCKSCKLTAKWERRRTIKKMLRRPCGWCSIEFDVPAKNPYQEFCSIPCGNAHSRNQRAIRRAS
jgi:hypothetical protein